MFAIKKTKEPASLAQLRGSGGGFGQLDKTAKDDLRASLHKEQHGLCAYCNSRINDDHTSRIEHFQPQSLYPKRQLDYTNLLLCCGDRYKCCDTTKRDKVIKYNPADKNFSSHVANLALAGRGAFSSNDADMSLQLEVLKLNDNQLCTNRYSTLEGYKKSMKKAKPNGPWSKSMLLAQLSANTEYYGYLYIWIDKK